MQKIDTIKLSYLLIRQYLLFGFKQFYNKIVIVGKENLPSDDSAIIFAPNHLNALMDALAILHILPVNKAIVFIAKADLFNSKFTTSVLNFAKILPAYRKVDGIENLNKNGDTFDACVDVLKRGEAIGIMPEGGQGEKHQIRPLVKGIFRIAFEAQKQLGNSKNVKIVPIGLDLGNLRKSSTHLIINIGKPIVINEYIEEYSINPSVTINATKQKLHQSLSELTLDIASDKYYDTIKFISDVEGHKFTPNKNEENKTQTQFIHKQQIIKNLLRIQRDEPEKMKKIDDEVKLLQEKMSEFKLTPAVFSSENISVLELIIGFPIFLFGFITNFLPMFVPVWIRKLIKVEYDGFYSSVQFIVGLITFPVFYTFQTVFIYKFILLNIWWSIIFLIMQFITRKYAIKWWKELKKKYKKQVWLNKNLSTNELDLILLKKTI